MKMTEYKKTASTYQIEKIKTDVPVAKISSAREAYSYIVKYLYNSDIDVYESFWLLLLNQANNIVSFVKISQGGINACVVDPILVAKYAINELAKSVLLAHNHPSGQLHPSQEDIRLTKQIENGLKYFGIHILDHLIITSDGFMSFSEEGLL